jgi:hypothetical protein
MMTSDAWQHIGELVGLLPWAAFVVAVAWCWLLELRENTRTPRTSEGPGWRRSGARIERSPSTDA